MTFEAREMIPADHPAIAGHFPGHPVVPGVLVLESVVAVVRRWRGTCRLREIRSARFVSPLAPGREFLVRLRERGEFRIAFECLLDGRTLASGELVVDETGMES